MQNGESPQQKHSRIARRFLEAADQYFDEGDYPQTSEKLWGAAAHSLRALCIRRRWRYGKYAHLREASRRLTEETGNGVFEAGFGLAYVQHLNFYNDTLEAQVIDLHRPAIREMVEQVLAAVEA